MLTKTRTARPLQHAIANLVDSMSHRDSQQARLADLIREKFAESKHAEIRQITLTREEYKKTFES